MIAVRLSPRAMFALYAAMAVALEVFEFTTAGCYRRMALVFALIAGFGFGHAIEYARWQLVENESRPLHISKRVLSRSSLYVVPLLFSDSLLLLTRLNSTAFVVAPIFILAVQIGFLLYIWKTISDKSRVS
ncbi:MAG: hypothetical protein ABFD49_04715 [Armatimonadota bacterium]|nr:hypothetical protein [bacterium]